MLEVNEGLFGVVFWDALSELQGGDSGKDDYGKLMKDKVCKFMKRLRMYSSL